MKGYVKIIYSIVSFAFAMLLICSCAKTPTIKTDIEITPQKEAYTYDSTIVSYAQNAIYTCLYEYETLNGGKELDSKEIEKLHTKAEKLQKTIPCTLEPSKYSELFVSLSTHSSEIVDGYMLLKNGDTVNGFSKLKKAYLALSNIASAEFVGEALYNAAIAGYEEKYSLQMEAYEKYGQKYMLDKANEYLNRRDTLVNDVGKESLSRLIRYFFLVGDLFYGNAFENGQINGFTNEEILIFIQSVDLSELAITEKGYELLLTTYGEAIIVDKSKTFFDKVMFEATQNKDVEKLAYFIKEMTILMSKAQEKMQSDDIELLRNGKSREFLFKCIERFDESDWKCFEKITSQEINVDDYNTLAISYYGEEFEAYLQDYKTVSLDELKASCGTDGFNQALKEYIAGICPAFSYDMNY